MPEIGSDKGWAPLDWFVNELLYVLGADIHFASDDTSQSTRWDDK